MGAEIGFPTSQGRGAISQFSPFPISGSDYRNGTIIAKRLTKYEKMREVGQTPL